MQLRKGEEQKMKPTLEYVNEYIQARYELFNPLRVSWDILTEAEQEMFIKRSYDEISTLTLKNGVSEELIQNAVAENALAIRDKDISATSDIQLKTAMSQGELRNTKYSREQRGIENVLAPVEELPITGKKAYKMLKLAIGFVGNITANTNYDSYRIARTRGYTGRLI